MADSFCKFPRTQHIANLGAATRDDLIMDSNDANRLLLDPSLIIGKDRSISRAHRP